MVNPAALERNSQRRVSTQLSYNTRPCNDKPHAAFSIDMSDEFAEYIDWSKGDLLDACYDPAIGGMGLDM